MDRRVLDLMPRTFPVDTTQTYRPYNTSTLDVFDEGRWPRFDGEPISGSDPDVVLLEVLPARPVAFDPATEKLVDGTPLIDLVEETYRHVDVVVALSPAEAGHVQRRSDVDAAKLTIDDTRSGNGGMEERLARLEELVYLIADQIFV